LNFLFGCLFIIFKDFGVGVLNFDKQYCTEKAFPATYEVTRHFLRKQL